jgi:hypothetical protein
VQKTKLFCLSGLARKHGQPVKKEARNLDFARVSASSIFLFLLPISAIFG